MAPDTQRIGAAVDLGSTSVHLLVGRLDGHRVEGILDESVFLGLGEALESRGSLGANGRDELVAVLLDYSTHAREAGATDITFVGTEPLRRLADADLIVAEVGRATGMPIHVLSHEEEALLVLIGVTEGRRVVHDLLVVDIGGGSTELIFVRPGQRAIAAGLPIGATRLMGQVGASDPPGAGQLTALRGIAGEALAGAPPFRPAEIVVVGGPASNLLKVKPDLGASRLLTTADVAAAFDLVASTPSESIVARYGLRPARARILGAGAAIVEALMTVYDVSAVRVSEGGIREGTVLAVAHAGHGWREQLEPLAHGWVR
jgi:exopolyphosphatase / guanosine-5'-triphosphate,3'-diphosphate pyrophosphatase